MPIPILTKSVRGINSEDQSGGNIWSRIVYRVCHHRAAEVYKKIKGYLKGEKILDIGSGQGANAQLLIQNGFLVTGIDVIDESIFTDFKANMYDGENIPFKDKSFDTALIVHVLHHCNNPMKVLSEAVRVAKRVIVIEDTYRNGLERFAVSLNDMVGNFEFYFHTYHTQQEWRSIIKKQGWKLIADQAWSNIWGTAIPFYSRHYVFVIEK